MSFSCMAIVGDRKVGGPSQKLLLLILADHANKDGTGVWCSIETMAEETELSERTIQRLLTEFTESGLIKATGKYGRRKDRQTTVYDLDLAAIRALPPARSRGDTMTPREDDGVTPCRPRGDTMSPKPILEPTPKVSSIRSVELESDKVVGTAPAKPSPKPQKKVRRTATEETLPAAPTDRMSAHAEKEGFDPTRTQKEFRGWRDYHLARGSQIADQEASWRTWVANSKKFESQRGAKERSSMAFN